MNYTLKFRAKDHKNFDEIKSGLKPIETRAGTLKYQKIKVGETLTFVCGEDKLTKVESVDEMKKIYSSYPDYDKKIKEFGIIGF